MDAIEPLCGALLPEVSWDEYLQYFNATETDIAVMSEPNASTPRFPRTVHVLALEPHWLETHWYHPDNPIQVGAMVLRSEFNTEHELRVPNNELELYRELAGDLAKVLWGEVNAPETISATHEWEAAPDHLIETTSGLPVALRYQRTSKGQGKGLPIVTLALPHVENLAEWFRAFLQDVHQIDRQSVPTPPPRLSNPSHWYTPEQNRVARKIVHIESKIKRLEGHRTRLETEMRAAAGRAETGILRALHNDGDDLAEAVIELLAGIGFQVRNMDKERSPDDPNREDLRLTVAGDDTWEAIVEVKGYPNDTKSSDARQVREYRDLYRDENGRFPDLTLWVTNPHRRRDPSSRPLPNPALDEVTRVAETALIQTVDLFPIWRDVVEGRIDSKDAIGLIQSAQPGTWIRPTDGEEQDPQDDSTADDG
ncbi:MAG: hypothetical protein OXI97_20010 [Acidimicrobiaceae bacterium]|nr:hypothetical protein [Acidimicrobiaceae bacterium]